MWGVRIAAAEWRERAFSRIIVWRGAPLFPEADISVRHGAVTVQGSAALALLVAPL